MSVQVFEKSVVLPRPATDAFAWLEQPGALERLTPPWEKVRVVRPAVSLEDGSEVELEAKVGPFTSRWRVRHRDYRAGVQFCDEAIESPFAEWRHWHRVEVENSAEGRLVDRIEYRLPGGALGQWVAGDFVRRKLERLFHYRHEIYHDDLVTARRYGAVRRLRILLAGGSGFVGRALVPFLRTQGHEVVRLVRRPSQAPDEVTWQPGEAPLDPHVFRGIDAVINLAGEPIVEGRWTAERKQQLVESRLQATRTLVAAIEKAKHRPFVLVNASAIGFYGHRHETRLDEDAAQGRGFLAELCASWEREALAVEEWGVRAAVLRVGVVLSPDGGALGKMLPAFRAGAGGPLGDASHWFSWISRDDLLGAIYHCLMDQRCRGPLNAVAPQPVRQGELASTLGRVLGRPSFFRVPAFALRLLWGEMADEALLASTRAMPSRLQQAGFEFRHPQLAPALAFMLGRPWHPPVEESAPATTRRGGRPRRR